MHQARDEEAWVRNTGRPDRAALGERGTVEVRNASAALWEVVED
jgi:hypothetical protein